MAEKGFATIFGLCLILVIALVVKGIQESEMNHAYETANFQAEIELQNAADSALVEVADKVLSGAETLPVKQMPYRQRSYYQREFMVDKTSEKLGDITVSVWGEEITVQPYRINYSTKKATRIKNADVKGYVFFSKAQATSGGRQIYRRAFAYVEDGDDTIHFMDLPSSEYNF